MTGSVVCRHDSLGVGIVNYLSSAIDGDLK